MNYDRKLSRYDLERAERAHDTSTGARSLMSVIHHWTERPRRQAKHILLCFVINLSVKCIAEIRRVHSAACEHLDRHCALSRVHILQDARTRLSLREAAHWFSAMCFRRHFRATAKPTRRAKVWVCKQRITEPSMSSSVTFHSLSEVWRFWCSCLYHLNSFTTLRCWLNL